jgi:hypothetical protein
MTNPYTPPRSDVADIKRKSVAPVMHPVLRAVFALFGLAAILTVVNMAYDVLKSGPVDILAVVAILSLLCLGSVFTFMGLTGRDRFRR